LKEMAAKIEYIKPAFLFWPSLGAFQYTLYVTSCEGQQQGGSGSVWESLDGMAGRPGGSE
jgi:hypothetical protein